MFIGYFTERPYQDPKSGYFGATGKPIMDLAVSNDIYDPELGAELYNRYLDEKMYAEEMGFDGLMLNEHLYGGRYERGGLHSGAHHPQGQDRPAGEHYPPLGRSAMAGGATGDDRPDLPRPSRVGVGAWDRA